MNTLRVGDRIPDVELVGPDGDVWSPARRSSTTPVVLILHRHLA